MLRKTRQQHKNLRHHPSHSLCPVGQKPSNASHDARTPEIRRIIRRINRPVSAISKVISLFAESESQLDLPPAFRTVAKYLPLTSHILFCMKDELEGTNPDEETDESRRSRGIIADNLDSFRDLTDSLEDYYESVMPADGEDTAQCLGRYRKAVGDSNGERVECIMEKLVDCFIQVLEDVTFSKTEKESDTLLDQLHEANREIRKVPASLDEEKQKQYLFNNKDRAVMPIHMGKGDIQSHIGSGPGFNGNASNNRFDSAWCRDGESTPPHTPYRLRSTGPIGNMKAAG